MEDREKSIAHLIEKNAVDFFMNLGRLNQDEVYDKPEIKCILTPKWESRIFMANFDEKEASKLFHRIISKSNQLNISPLWYVSPFSRPFNLKKLLNDHYFYYLKDWKAMAIDLDVFTENFDIPENLEIKVVSNISELKNWVNVLVKGFKLAENKIESYKNYFTNLGVEQPLNFQFYLGIYNEKPVGSLILFEGSDAAGVYYVSTLHEARRKGVAAAMITKILYDAKNKGYRICVLHASEEGYPLYKKIGFKECYTTKIFKMDRNL
ncbi:GNAT family N-acetyltransferase [uncultured Methanobacterium sp.]|uniref:GNAT family N-acetyltransferase n=1 Tax=uncultured Methanobacterium sp. TaxID=176306 RepID=UPI002AA7A67A|nr:GNAT family N-acetyltransferase [uncultured Methanobacterium sp.]